MNTVINVRKRQPIKYNLAGSELLQNIGYKEIPYGNSAKVNHGLHWVSPSYLHWNDEFQKSMIRASENQNLYKLQQASENNPAFRFRKHRRGGTTAVSYNPASNKFYRKNIGPRIYVPKINNVKQHSTTQIPKNPIKKIKFQELPKPKSLRSKLAEEKHYKRFRKNIPMP